MKNKYVVGVPQTDVSGNVYFSVYDGKVHSLKEARLICREDNGYFVIKRRVFKLVEAK